MILWFSYNEKSIIFLNKFTKFTDWRIMTLTIWHKRSSKFSLRSRHTLTISHLLRRDTRALKDLLCQEENWSTNTETKSANSRSCLVLTRRSTSLLVVFLRIYLLTKRVRYLISSLAEFVTLRYSNSNFVCVYVTQYVTFFINV